jgi:hypothetical protein
MEKLFTNIVGKSSVGYILEFRKTIEKIMGDSNFVTSKLVYIINSNFYSK